MIGLLTAADGAITSAGGTLRGQTAEVQRIHDWLDVLSPPTVGDVGLRRTDSTTYTITLPVDGGQYVELEFRHLTGIAVHQLAAAKFIQPVVPVDQGDASIVHVGFAATATGTGTSYGGSFRLSVTAGNTVTHTTPADTTVVGFYTVAESRCGLAKVTIDGDDTLANLLPTAQEVVDSGAYANTILVANGGTLDPTDRVMDNFRATGFDYGKLVPVADGLAPGVHTVVYTNTGYQHTSGTGIRLYSDGVTYATTTTTPTDADVINQVRFTSFASTSAYEYAYEYGSGFIGNIHASETQDSLTFTVDGVPTTLADGEAVSGDTIGMVRTTRLFDPADGTTKIADVVTTYTATAGRLRVQHTDTWTAAATDSTSKPRYTAMLPLAPDYQRAWLSNLTAATDIVFGASTQRYGTERAYGTILWDDQYVSAVMVNDNKTVNSWRGPTGRLVQIEARVSSGTPTLTKVYIDHGGPIVASDVWRADVTYRWAVVPDAETVITALA